MPNPKHISHYCEACQKSHQIITDAWNYWRTKRVGKTKLYWCHKGIDCAGCGHVHRKNGISKLIGDKWYCNKWFKKTGNGQIDFSQYSPQEVVSGVPYGLDRDASYGPDTEDHSIVHGAQTEALEQALIEVEEQDP